MDIGVQVVSIDDLVKQKQEGLDALMVTEKEDDYSSLRSHILKSFQTNREARENGGVNKLLLEALRAYNGQYDPEDLALIAEEGGSRIFMNLTSTKVRAAISWIKDILLAGKQDAFGIEITPVVDLPEGTEDKIRELITKEFEKLINPPPPPQQPGQEAAPAPPPPDLAQTVRELNEYKRDLHEAILSEVNKEAAFEFKKLELKIKDRMKEGSWEKALSEVIDDFCIFPTAFLKGPIVTRKKRLKWENGEAVAFSDYVFLNKRVSPLDIYPAPEASSPQDGDFIEHIRLSRRELSSFMKAGEEYKYKTEAIRKVLENSEGKGVALDTNIEDDKAKEELKDTSHFSNKNVYHGLHYWGSVSVKMLKEWDMEDESLAGLEDEESVEVEAILVGTEVIKCVINDDPLERRPYFCASFQKRPGSIWGAAPPYLMRDIQRMCNACARALANNMGLSSGAIMELVVDRLADGQDVRQLRPGDIIQTTSDPVGGNGRAVQFFTVPSVAQDLLAVYNAFSIQADDVTMIPRYAYGNERVGGAAQTASGLSMLLESANKGIKDAIRHIDEGIIIPRVELEFYTTMLAGEDTFTGDINVLAYGSQMLTMAGAEQMRRNEFLQVTANPIDQEIMGPLARAEILRVMTVDLGLGEDLIPNRQELKAQMKQKAEQQQQPPPQVQAAQIQNETIYQIAQERNQLEAADLQRKQQKDAVDAQIKSQQMEMESKNRQMDQVGRLQATQMKTASQEHQANQKIAVELQRPE
jgi:hypothetical protein